MSNMISDLEPKVLWKHFHSLTTIPRPSKHEEKVVQFIKEFGEGLGLETIIDKAGNVIIRKPATPGMEDCRGVILQGHLDMVPQKNSDTAHDFLNDPIQAYIDGDWITAKGTTLGSDNGMGVAAAMAVLESNDLVHGPVEALFTIDEEAGMTGAKNLQPGVLQGDILLNMDSEDEGELYIGCAGGVDTVATFAVQTKSVGDGFTGYRIKVSGFRGGHSGLDIHLDRGNACLLICKIMQEATKEFGLRISSIDAGSLRNAIPREAFADVLVPESSAAAFERFVSQAEEREQKMFKDTDPGVKIALEKNEKVLRAVALETQDNLLKAVAECPNGAIKFSEDMPGIVETSSNLAIIKSKENGIEIACLTRSAVDTERDRVAGEIAEVFRKYGASAVHSGQYPGWKPDVDSAILNLMKEVYNEKYGKVPEVKVIHAGLECGILGSKYVGWDMISFGPTIRYPHSPDEKVNIPSVEKFWGFLLETLKNIPKKG